MSSSAGVSLVSQFFSEMELHDTSFLPRFLRPLSGRVLVDSNTFYRPWVASSMLGRPGYCVCYTNFFVILWRMCFVLFNLGQSWAGVSYLDLNARFPDNDFNFFRGVHVHYARCNLCDSCVERCNVFSTLVSKFLCDCIINVKVPFIRICIVDPNLVPNWRFEFMSTFLAGVIPVMHRLNFEVKASLSVCSHEFFILGVADRHFLALIDSFRAFFPNDFEVATFDFTPQPFFRVRLISPIGSNLGHQRRILSQVHEEVTDGQDLADALVFVRPLADLRVSSDSPFAPIYMPPSASGSLPARFVPHVEPFEESSDEEHYDYYSLAGEYYI